MDQVAEVIPPALNLSANNLLVLLLASERSDLLWLWDEKAKHNQCWACNAELLDLADWDECPNCGASSTPF